MEHQAFDEKFYLSRYPGVAEAVKQGHFTSGLDHYKRFGVKENRLTSENFDIHHQRLMLGFCALGNNCEFGMAQRAFGAEPLDLLKWASTPHSVLLDLLRSKLERLGDVGQLEVYDSSGEYLIKHNGYKYVWHAWAQVGKTTPEAILTRETKRLPLLARKLKEDLASGLRIFVAKQQLGITRASAIAILESMHLYGRATLMYVTEGAPVAVVKEGDYLLHASIPKFADPTCVNATLAPNDWLAACKLARALVP